MRKNIQRPRKISATPQREPNEADENVDAQRQDCKKRKHAKALRPVVTLTPEEQQRYDYFLLEAVRQEYLKHYDVTFSLLQHCLSINPYAASAHYRLSQYYLFL